MKPALATAALLLLLLGGCMSNRRFAPRIDTHAWSPSGMPAATYALGEGAQRAELRVWSDGADLQEEEAGERTLLHLGLELVNLGEVPLTLEPGDVHVQDVQGTRGGHPVELALLEPVQVTGGTSAAPGKTARLTMWFEPSGLRPRQIEGFDVRWSVRIQGRAFEQVTPFAPWIVPPVYLGDYWYGGFWGYGWGHGHGHHVCH